MCNSVLLTVVDCPYQFPVEPSTDSGPSKGSGDDIGIAVAKKQARHLRSYCCSKYRAARFSPPSSLPTSDKPCHTESSLSQHDPHRCSSCTHPLPTAPSMRPRCSNSRFIPNLPLPLFCPSVLAIKFSSLSRLRTQLQPICLCSYCSRPLLPSIHLFCSYYHFKIIPLLTLSSILCFQHRLMI